MKSQFPPNLDEDEPIYKTDSFRMFCFKVLPCSKRFCHDWTTCPFSHPAEKARRRDPRAHVYTGVACPDQKKNACCPRGDGCTFAHNVFEYHLHPSRYRTALCNDGVNCSRKICFFAHTMDELRVSSVKVVPPESAAAKLSSPASDTLDMDPFNCQAEEVHKTRSSTSTSPVSPLYLEPAGSGEITRRGDLQQKPKRMSHEVARTQYKHNLQRQRNSVDVADLQMQQMQLRSVEAALNAQMQLQMQQTSMQQSLAISHHDAGGSNANQLAQALAHLQLASRLVNQDQLLKPSMPSLQLQPPLSQQLMPNLTHVLMQQLLLQQQAQQDQLLQQLQINGHHQPAHGMCDLSMGVGMLPPGHQASIAAGLSAARGARPLAQAPNCSVSMGEFGLAKPPASEFVGMQDLGAVQLQQFPLSTHTLGGI